MGTKATDRDARDSLELKDRFPALLAHLSWISFGQAIVSRKALSSTASTS
jgi:hypothetical protein